MVSEVTSAKRAYKGSSELDLLPAFNIFIHLSLPTTVGLFVLKGISIQPDNITVLLLIYSGSHMSQA